MKRILLALLVILAIASSVQQAHAVTIKLGWNASNGAAGYKIYYGTAARTYSTVIDVKNVLTYTTPNLPEGATYYFAATAYDSTSLESDYSAEVSYMAIATVKNTRLAVVTSTTPAGAVITWDSVSGASGYKVKYGTSSGTYTTTIDAKTATQYLLTGLANATTYRVVVAAYGADGRESGNSNELIFNTLGAVTGLTAQ